MTVSNSFDGRQTARHIRARHDVAVAERRQGDEAKVDCAVAADPCSQGLTPREGYRIKTAIPKFLRVC
jgi:hypothetical protein